MDLTDYKVFQGLNKTQRDNFVAACTVHSFPAGKELITLGARGTSVFFLIEGELRVFLPNGETGHLATLTPPAVVGEMELLTGMPRSANVVASTPIKVLGIPFETLRARIDDNDVATLRVMYNISVVIASRLAATVAKLGEIESTQHSEPEELHAFRQKLFSEWTF